MKYFFVGFMGSGKSYIGKRVSKRLNLQYIDLDEYIEQAEDSNILEIFNNKGESYFRKLEEKYLEEIIKRNDILVSTGGGTPTFRNLMDLMNHHGDTLYLECCKETLYNRLRNRKGMRPTISTLSNNNLKEYIEKKLKEREPFYNKAKYTVNNDSNTNCLEKIIEKLG